MSISNDIDLPHIIREYRHFRRCGVPHRDALLHMCRVFSVTEYALLKALERKGLGQYDLADSV